jgi:hypothetical protein
MYATKNIVMIALMQVGVIVAGVLGAGTSWKWLTSFNPLPAPAGMVLLMNYGASALILPLVWAILVLRLRGRATISEDMKNLACFSGVLLLLALGIGMGYIILSPWFDVDWHMSQES